MSEGRGESVEHHGDEERDDAPLEPERGEGVARLLGGRVSAVLGLLFALGGLISVAVSQSGAASDVSAGVVGIGLGVVGYFLGSNRLGTAAIIVSVAVLFFSLAATQGIIPGFETDRGLPAVEPRAGD